MDVIAFLHGRLAEDLPLAALLASYRGGPAVFSEKVPPDASPPWVLIEGVVRDSSEDCRGLRLRRQEVRLRCLDRGSEGGGRLQAIAARVRALLHGEGMAAASGALLAQSCSGPLLDPGEAGFQQRRLELSLLFNDLEEA